MRPIATLFALGCVVAAAFATLALAGPQGDEVRLHPALATLGGTRDGYTGDVAYNAHDQQYLAAWTADGLATDNDTEVFVRRVDTAGAPVGDPTRISTTGVEGVASLTTVDTPAVAADPATGNWFVAWTSPETGREIYGQLVGPDGGEIGSDLRLSNAGTDVDTLNTNYADVAFNTVRNEYLVVFARELTDTETEVFGQRVSAAGALIGDDFRITTTGATDSDGLRAYVPRIAYDSADDQYLVSYHRNWATGVGDALNLDVSLQRVDGNGTLLGVNTRITTTGTDSDDRGSSSPVIAYNPILNNYLLAYQSDAAPLANDKNELFVQRLTNTGALTGAASQVTTTPGTANAIHADLSYAALPAIGNYLLAWDAYTGVSSNSFAMRLTASGAQSEAAFPLARGTGAGLDSIGPRISARDGSLEWLAVWTSTCRASPQHAEPFARRVTTGVATGAANCGADAPTPEPTPTTGVGAAPPASAPTPVAPAPPAKPAALTAASVFTFPSSKRCVSRRSFRIRLRAPQGTTLASAEVTVNGKHVSTIKGRRLTAPINLRTLPKGGFSVRIKVRATDGRTVSSSRRYRTCAPKRSRG